MRPLLFFAFLLPLVACDDNRIYERQIDLEEGVWQVDTRPEFTFTIRRYKSPYRICYLVRNSLDFPFSRLFVQYTLYDQTGEMMAEKLDARYLFDQKTGKPYGQNGLGTVFSHSFPIFTEYRFPRPGRYTLRLEQFNRRDTLPGVLSVGARVEYAP